MIDADDFTKGKNSNFLENLGINEDLEKMMENLRCEMMNEQHKTVLYMRSYFILLYSYMYPKEASLAISHNDLLDDVFYASQSSAAPIDSLSSQVLSSFLKSLYESPRKFIKSLMKSKNIGSYNFFAFSTFPALFGFFSTQELCDASTVFMITFLQESDSIELAEKLTLAILFSSYSFLNSFCHEISQHPVVESISFEYVRERFSQALKIAISNLPSHAYFTLSTLNAKHPKKVISILQTFILNALKIWKAGSSTGLLLPAKYEEYINEKEFQDMLRKIFFAKVIPTYELPSLWKRCGGTQESIVFCPADLQILVSITSYSKEAIPMWSTIENASKTLAGYRFKPFTVMFFQNVKRSIQRFKKNLFEFDTENKTEQLENYITIKLEQQHVKSFQMHVRSMFDVASSIYFKESVKRMFPNVSVCDIPRLMESYSFGSPEDFNSLNIFCSILTISESVIPSIPSSIVELFNLYVCRLMNGICEATNDYISKPFVVELMHYLPGTSDYALGDIVSAFSYVFMKIDEIIEIQDLPFEYKVLLYKFAIIVTDSHSVLRVFLLMRELFFKTDVLSNFLPKEVCQRWMTYVAIIEKIISNDKILKDSICSISFVNN